MPPWSSIGGATITNAQAEKPFPCFLNVATYRQNTGSSVYNAAEASVQKRFSHGISIMGSFTWSKLIDDASSVFSTTVLSSPNSSSLSGANVYDPGLERDVSNGDIPFVFSASGSYELPFGRGHRLADSGISNILFGGWTLSAFALVQSGMPVTVTQATNFNAFAGFALQRPNVHGSTSLPSDQRTPQKYFNTAAFYTAPIYTLGNASRNPVRGPGYGDLDIALSKNFTLPREAGIEFRAEIYNVTNTPAFAQPNGSFGSPAFGSITSTISDPRVVQFAIRIYH